MNILVLNAGSSSLKYAVFHNEKLLGQGLIQRIGEKGKIRDHEQALRSILPKLPEIDAIGHRMVHGKSITKPQRVSKKLIAELKKTAKLAPLHNYPEIKVIELCIKYFSVPNIVVFDTSFHTTIPEFASTYAIPYELSRKNDIKRYGFHGTSHEYVAKRASEVLRKPVSKLKLITCHLGNGCSVTAIKNGRSIDTSMGYTPLEGLVMGTRCGDIDPGVVTYLMQFYNKEQLDELLNKKSGLLGISGISNDIRDLEKSKKKEAKLAIDVFCYRIKKYIGSYIAALNGADAVIFTAGIGEHEHCIRQKIIEDLDCFGIRIDAAKNKKNNAVISAKNSKIKVLVIPTNEELMIARQVKKLIK